MFQVGGIEKRALRDTQEVADEEQDANDNPLHIFTLGPKVPLGFCRRGTAQAGGLKPKSSFISVLGKNSGSVPNIDQKLANESSERSRSRSGASGGTEHAATTVATPSYQQQVSAGGGGNDGYEAQNEGQGLPRTLSTSVLRIKHKRSFWEKVVG